MARPANEPDTGTFAGRVGALFRKRREAVRLSVEQAAELAGVPASTWYRWEQGSNIPRMDRLPDIAQALKCSPRQLVPER